MQFPDGPIAMQSVAEVDGRMPISDRARGVLSASVSHGENLDRLLHEDLPADAIRLFPYLIPVRQGVWWGCLCAWLGMAGRPTPEEDKALRAIVHWTQIPIKDHQQLAVASADDEMLYTAAGCCARSIQWAGGVAAPNGPWSDAEPDVAAKLIAGTVFLAMAQAQQNRIGVSVPQLLGIGVEITQGRLPCDLVDE